MEGSARLYGPGTELERERIIPYLSNFGASFTEPLNSRELRVDKHSTRMGLAVLAIVELQLRRGVRQSGEGGDGVSTPQPNCWTSGPKRSGSKGWEWVIIGSVCAFWKMLLNCCCFIIP